nr:hypothetical protein HmN_000660400 [Hymenolepis microstoma]
MSYSGKIIPVDNPHVPDLGPSSNSLLHLAECIPTGRNVKSGHCDNWFASLKLIDHPASRQIRVCGTVQESRLEELSFTSVKQLSDSGRGSSKESDTQNENATVTTVKWFDNSSVCLVSSYAEDSIKSKNRDEVDISRVVHIYNQHMGGADLHDRLMAYHRMAFGSRNRVSYDR